MSDTPVTADAGEEYLEAQATVDDRDLLADAPTSRESDIVDDWGHQSFPASDAPQNW